MASMTARAYLEKIMEICKEEDAAGRCVSTKDPNGKGCPLFKYSCGIPSEKGNIAKVIDLVQKYKKQEKEACPHCGRAYAEIIEKQNIRLLKFCPYCGEKIQNEGRPGE